MNVFERFCFIAAAFVMVCAASAEAVTVTFRQGVGGYSQAQDTVLLKLTPNTNYGTTTTLALARAGAPDEEQTLMGFYGIFGNGVGQIPFGATINSASLSLSNVGITVPAIGEIHQMFIPWTDTVETWNTLSGGLDNLPTTEFDPLPAYSGNFGSSAYSVTSSLQSWSIGNPNYGFAIIPTASGTLAFSSSEVGSINSRPLLTVDYAAVPEPASTTLVFVLGAIMLGLHPRHNIVGWRAN